MSARPVVVDKRPGRGANPMQSAVHWALLGLVIERPSYGYELAQRFEHAYAGMLQLSGVSYVYTALDTLQYRSMIEEIPGTRTGRQPKPRYRATSEGVRSYQERLIAQMHEDLRRSRLFARQLAAFAQEPEMALDVIERYGQACLEEAGETPVLASADGGASPASGLASRLVSEERRLALEARLPWIDYARREFKALAAGRMQP
ncbi:MAG TPA: PadR family transcriptional regulator [Solirubrobacteraceae bacterium]|jgi:DNA-binding PadR family transcriptional regulator|nr:PadR family transcriptional regulator [Solirubrobacteraceae bacterium]